MSNSNNSINNLTSYVYSRMIFSNTAQAYLYHFLISRTLRQALCNPVIIIILIVNFTSDRTNIPWIIDYNFVDMTLVRTSDFAPV